MLGLLFAHVVLGVVIIGVGDRLGRSAFLLAAIGPLASIVWAGAHADKILDGQAYVEQASWVDGLGMSFDLRIDGFGLLMIALIAGIGVLICLYSLSYFAHPAAGTARLAGLLAMFAGAMTGLVSADNIVMLFLCWEATSIISYLLIGNGDRDPRARAAALQALVITGAGGLALLAGLIMVGGEAGSYSLSGILEQATNGDGLSGTIVTAGLVCILAGAFTKSAQLPFGSWLPGAMVAPTPISAYLHSATMVKAGVYLIARLSPAFAEHAPWRALCVVVGLATMVVGALRALRQTDLKLLLAMGTVSQLGFLVALFGLGIPAVTKAAVVLLAAHALFKSALFMVVGIVDHGLGTRDIRRIGALDRSWRPTKVVAVISAASMAGIPLTFGFIAKEAVIDGLLEYGDEVVGGAAILTVVLVASALTLAYSGRFVLGVYGRFEEPATDPVGVEQSGGHAHHGAHAHDVGHHEEHASMWPFLAPAAVLSAITLVLGIVPGLTDRVMTAAVSALVLKPYDVHLKLWHGVNSALLLSGLVIVVGLGLIVARDAVARAQRVPFRWPSTERGYLGFLRGLNVTADRTTAVVQSGSLPVYIGVILLTAAIVPSIALLAGDGWAGLPQWVDLPIHVPIAALMIAAAFATARAQQRFSAALLLGIVGYGIAGLYVAQGAPDLALTQFAIETLSVVLFMLVLRFLPDELTSRTPPWTKLIRLVISGLVGLFVFVFAITMAASRTEAPISDELIERSVPDGKGGNVVNVIIVDFRGLDTLGEITVLVVAALGAVGLARVGHRDGRGTAA
jgi:multicomponent Na+:H+ antiporter subunit A